MVAAFIMALARSRVHPHPFSSCTKQSFRQKVFTRWEEKTRTALPLSSLDLFWGLLSLARFCDHRCRRMCYICTSG